MWTYYPQRNLYILRYLIKYYFKRYYIFLSLFCAFILSFRRLSDLCQLLPLSLHHLCPSVPTIWLSSPAIFYSKDLIIKAKNMLKNNASTLLLCLVVTFFTAIYRTWIIFFIFFNSSNSLHTLLSLLITAIHLNWFLNCKYSCLKYSSKFCF